jgi:SAM-dependent methyltransferase
MSGADQDLDSVREYYCAPRAVGSGDLTIYEIWEAGGAFRDSITPSTYVPEYRAHIVEKILEVSDVGATVFSIGCGNGFVEADLVGHNRAVRAMDYNDEAVELTRRKGVDAFKADFFELTPADFADVDVVYADGLLGHLFHPEQKVAPALAKLASLAPRAGTRLVFSNDSPRDPAAAFAPHEAVEGFWFVSKDYLAEQLATVGFVPKETYYFAYDRPLSGIRNRTIVIAVAT